jgi:hypothetical protein
MDLPMKLSRSLLLIAVALAAASCAGPAKLARQSDEALAKGDVRKAYDKAQRAVEKDPMNAAARSAYDAASRRMADDYKARVRALAAADSLGAADLALEFRGFRGSVAAHGSSLVPDGAYESDEARLLGAAARTHYRYGRASLTSKRPKEAWREFELCRRYDGWADFERLQAKAYDAALTRVAVFPFEDGIRVPGLSQEVAGQIDRELARRGGGMRFTEIVDPAKVTGTMTVAQSLSMSREAAVALGRKIGADRIVVGRFGGLRSNHDLKDLTLPIYRRVETKDETGATVTRWDEATLRVVTRERAVTVNWGFDVLDTRTGDVVEHRDVPTNTAARVVWTDFKPVGDCDHYALLPPDVRSKDSSRAKQVDAQWDERLGSWKLVELLKRAQSDRSGRTRWSADHRREFRGVDSRRRPVWLAELPGEDDLAFVALDDAWKPVLASLQDLDAKD